MTEEGLALACTPRDGLSTAQVRLPLTPEPHAGGAPSLGSSLSKRLQDLTPSFVTCAVGDAMEWGCGGGRRVVWGFLKGQDY